MALDTVVLITGASAGIGYATALEFARFGARVAAVARRLERLQTLQEAAADLPGEILPLAGDVTRAEDMIRAVQQTVEKWGRLDVLVANAGIGHRGGIVDSDWTHIDTVLRTNIDGVLHSVRAAVPAMRQTGHGHILLISSISGVAPAPFAATYGASKSFVNGLARALRYELKEDGILVTSFLVGQTHSEFAQARLGRSGRVAGKLPTMSADYVAHRIVGSVGRQRRSLALRWLDYAFIFAATFTPWLIDHLQWRVYRDR